jgi:hypothetical protein
VNRSAATIANGLWGLASLSAYYAFRDALRDPGRAQRQQLERYVRQHADTAFGREHSFDQVDGVESFRRRVPVRDYDAIAPWIDRVASGEMCVLTADRVTRFVPSSGSTRSAKLIPYTSELHREFNRAMGPWICDLFRRTPELIGGCAYWSITPVAQTVRPVESAVPIGFDDDTAYLGGARKRLVEAVMAVPSSVRHAEDVETYRYLTARFLLARGDLALVSIWHPSFFELILDTIAHEWHRLLADLADRHDVVARLRAAGPDNPGAIWPHLKLVSCWCDAHAAGPAEALRRRLRGVPVQAKGLLATEGFVSIPFADHWPVAVRSHFIEFEDDDGRLFTTDELRPGGEYGVILTTGGGLWRYRLGDRVRCHALLDRTPSIRFVGRQDMVVDRFGEKLSEGFVGRAIRELLAEFGVAAPFAMLAPASSRPPWRYTLFVQSSPGLPDSAAARLDQMLSENPNYAHCRKLGQLGPLDLFRISRDGYLTYARQRQREGRQLGSLKPPAIDGGSNWAVQFLDH